MTFSIRVFCFVTLLSSVCFAHEVLLYGDGSKPSTLAAMSAVLGMMRYPDGAVFSGIEENNQGIVCGFVEGIDGFGRHPFMYKHGVVATLGDTNNALRFWNYNCTFS